MADRRAHSREQMPESAAEIDGWRAVFGPPNSFWCEEGGKRIAYRWVYPPGPPFTAEHQAAPRWEY